MDEIFVTGGNHHNTLGVIRSLGYCGIKPNLILVGGKRNSYTARSRYISRLFLADDEDCAISLLLEEKARLEHAVVIACSDGMSSALDMNKNKLTPVYAIPGTKEQGKLTNIMNKEFMSKFGAQIGFHVPDSWVVETKTDVFQVEYPCITKPILSQNGHKSDVRICFNQSDLMKLLEEGTSKGYQVQRFIEKEFEYQLIGLSLNEGEQLIIPGVSRCLRPCRGTNTGFLHYESLDGFDVPMDTCRRFVKEVGYSGLFSIEFLRGKDGNDYFMEMNFRNDGNSICVTASGTNLPYLWYLANSGGNVNEVLQQSTFKPVYVMPEFDDFREFVYHGKIGVFKWLKDLNRTDQFMEFDKTDVKPFFIGLKEICLSFIKKRCLKY